MRAFVKRGVSLFVAAALCLSSAPWTYAADTEEPAAAVLQETETVSSEGDYVYTVQNGEVTITDYTGTAVSLSIPAYLEGLPVTRIGEDAFYGCTDLEEVVLPEGVTYLGNAAFGGMGELKVYFPSTVTAVQSYGAPFRGTTLKEIKFAEGTNYLAPRLFMWATVPEEMILPETVTSMGQGVFSECKGLTSVVLPDGLKEIPSEAFYNVKTLTDIQWPKGLETISKNAFYGCTGLEEIVLPEGVTYLADGVFGRVGELKVHIPSTLTDVEYYGAPFRETTLTEIEFADGITYLAPRLFMWATVPEEVVLPETITSMGAQLFASSKGLTSVVLPDGLKEIPSEAFYEVRTLTDIRWPEGLEIIGDGTFCRCTGLEELVLPETVTRIEGDAFYDCTGLEEIVLPEGMNYLGDGAFGRMGELKVHIPGTLTDVEYHGAPFRETTLTEIGFAEGITYLAPRLFSRATVPEEMSLPETVTSMGQGVFAECKGLTSVVLPDGLKEIPLETFYNVQSLTSAELPEGLEIIRKKAFYGTKLSQLKLPEALTLIESYAFYNCDWLFTVTLPVQMQMIEEYAFGACDRLEVLFFGGNKATAEERVLHNSPNAELLCSDRSEMAVFAMEKEMAVTMTSDSAPREILTEHSNYIVNTNMAMAGNLLNVTVKYSFQHPDDIGWANLKIKLPPNVGIAWNGVTINGENAEYLERNGLLQISVPAEGGRVEFSLRILGEGDICTYAVMETDLGREIIRVLREPMPEVTFTAPDYVGQDCVSVTGMAAPNTWVRLYVDGVQEKDVKADLQGTFSATLTLPDPVDHTIYTISAEAGNGTAAKQVRYLAGTPRLQEFLMYYNNHENTVMDLLEDRNTRPHISFNPSYDITLTAKFENGENIEKVWFTTTRNGITNAVEAVFNGTHYVGVLTNGDYRNDPGTIGVEYSLKMKHTTMDQAINALEYVSSAVGTLIPQEHVTVKELEEAEVETMEGLEFEQAQEITVDMSSLDLAFSPVVRIEKYSYSGKYPAGILNENIPGVGSGTAGDSGPAISTLPISGLRTCYRSGSAPMKEYSPAASSTDGWVRFTVKDRSGNAYNVAYKATGAASDDSELEDFVCVTENIATSEVVRFVVKAGSNGDAFEIMEALENAGVFYEAVGTLYDLYEINKEHEELEKQIRQRYQGEEQEEALRKARELKHNRQDFTLSVAALGAGLGAMGVLSGPAGWTMAAILFGMTAASEFFWEHRMNSILGGIFEANWIQDPSGYVYEAVTSNRVSGVETTAYWIPEPEDADMEQLDAFYAQEPDENEMGQKWEGEAYGQINPLHTDADGAYAWDVPCGWWRVRYVKEGYETTYSRWLPVPPPQLEVNVPVVSYEAPELELVEAEADQVEVTFTKYMKPETVRNALTINGQSAEVLWSEAETDAEGTVYARTFTLLPSKELKADSTVVVEVSSEAVSYAGTAAEEGSIETVVGATPALEVPEAVQVACGGRVVVPFTVKNVEKPEVEISVTPASVADVQLSVSTSGKGQMMVYGLLPASATAVISVKGTELAEQVEIQVLQEQAVSLISADSIVARPVLGNAIDFQFGVPKTAVSDWTGCYAVVTKEVYGTEDKQTVLPYEEWGEAGPYWAVEYSGMAAKEMNDEITMQLFDGKGNALSEEKVYSIRAYAERNYATQSDEYRTLLVDMLNYGAEAQKQFGYDTEHLANAFLTQEQQAMATQTVEVENKQVGGENFFMSRLVLESRIQLQFGFQNIDTDCYAVYTYAKHTGVVVEETTPVVAVGGSIYGVFVEDLDAADGRALVTVTVYNADGEEVAYAADSVESYVARNSSVAINEAIMKYCDAANAALH